MGGTEETIDATPLLISGYADHPLLDAAHAAGEPCLVKPFELSTFSDTVQQLLSRAA